MPITCVALPFSMLEPRQAYDVWRLRQDVFVVEQACAYADLDGRDLEPGTRHVLLRDGEKLLGCARVLDDRVGSEPVWRLGRVVLRSSARGRGLAEPLITTALAVGRGRVVVCDAQTPVADLYRRLGFEVVGAEFLDDGIPHLPMRRPDDSSAR